MRRAVIVDKIPLLKQCREFLRLSYGITDYDEVLHVLCLGIYGDHRDRDHIREMAYGDMLSQEPVGETIPELQKAELMRFLIGIRGHIIRQLYEGCGYPRHQHIRYLEIYSRTSLSFEVFE